MAQIDIKNIYPIAKDRNLIQDKVPATYTIFEKDGKKYFQIDTYGRTGRKNPEKISQSFQLDENTARFLVNILSDQFDLK